MPGPSKQFDAETALAEGMTLFWQRGYADVSMSDLLTSMRIGRQSFYNTFGSKAALFDRVIDRYVRDHQRPLLECLTNAESPNRGILQFLKRWQRAAEERPNHGCLLVNCIDDYAALEEQSATQIQEAIHHFEQTLLDAIKASIRAEEIHPTVSAFKLATILVALGNGLMLRSRESSSRTPPGLLVTTYQSLAGPVVDS